MLSDPWTTAPCWTAARTMARRAGPANTEEGGRGAVGVPGAVPVVVIVGAGVLAVGVLVVWVEVVDPLGGGGGGSALPTTIVAVMNGCMSQWNVYVPAVANVHVPLQPGAVGWAGSGGTAPLEAPAVCVQLVGCGPLPKSALWSLPPVG
jgi:hypothetical protein